MQKNPFLILASFFGATGVALGAMGAHALKEKVKEGLMTQEQLAAWDTGSKYQLLHAIVLLFIFLFLSRNDSKLVKVSGWLIAIGILFFSGSIYCLTTQGITSMNFRFMGPITPLGGSLMIAGWVCLLVFAFKKGKEIK